MWFADGVARALRAPQVVIGLALVLVGEGLIVAQIRPVSEYSFPLLWFGYILAVDGGVQTQTGRSLLRDSPALFWSMFPVSAAFWWLFEAFNTLVHNWQYVGAGVLTGPGFVAIASLDFSTVLPAVWLTALAINCLVGGRLPDEPVPAPPRGLLAASFGIGIAAIALPALAPSWAFGLIWICMFFLIDPINALLGRTSLIAMAWSGNFALIWRFAAAGLICGFFWESWNFWSTPQWIYHIPHVGFLHVFEMPILGYGGYLPFGLELFAMATLVLPTLGLSLPLQSSTEPAARRPAA
jgi:hypothetical protein